MLTIEQTAELEAASRKAETGEQWADVCRREADMIKANASPQLCRDCTFFLAGDNLLEPGFNARCEHPATASINLVSGGTELGWCNLERTAFGECGRSGLLFIQRDPIQDAPDATIGASAMGG